MRHRFSLTLFLTLVFGSLISAVPCALADSSSLGPPGWTTGAPREEIRPEFEFDPSGGVDGKGCLVIRADSREGLDGWWTKMFPVSGGKAFRFSAFFKAGAVAVPRRSVVVKIDWQDDRG